MIYHIMINLIMILYLSLNFFSEIKVFKKSLARPPALPRLISDPGYRPDLYCLEWRHRSIIATKLDQSLQGYIVIF